MWHISKIQAILKRKSAFYIILTYISCNLIYLWESVHSMLLLRCYKSDINDHFTFLLYCHVFISLRRSNEVHHAVVKIIATTLPGDHFKNASNYNFKKLIICFLITGIAIMIARFDCNSAFKINKNHEFKTDESQHRVDGRKGRAKKKKKKEYKELLHNFVFNNNFPYLTPHLPNEPPSPKSL